MIYPRYLQTLATATLAVTVALLNSCNPSPSQTSQTIPSSPTTPIATPSEPTSAAPKVVATSSVVCDLTKEIAGDTVDLTCLIKPGSDPHVYEPRPEDRRAIEDAQLILYSGYDFEPSLIKLVESTSNSAPKVAVAEVAVPQPEQFEEDGQTVADPHVWHNAQNGIRMVEAIQNNLATLVPEQAELYNQNAQSLSNKLGQIDTWVKSQIATIPPSSRKLITTHDALGYYSKAYGIPVDGALQGISTEEKPTANRIKELVKNIKDDKVPTIFAEVTINPKLIEAVAKEANVKVSEEELFTDGLGEPGSEGDTYAKMLIANTTTIVEGLGGSLTPFNN